MTAIFKMSLYSLPQYEYFLYPSAVSYLGISRQSVIALDRLDLQYMGLDFITCHLLMGMS